MFLRNGTTLPDHGFTHDDISYPPGWIALASADERAALGIIEVPAAPSARHHWDGVAWVIDAASLAALLADLRTSRLAAINAAATRALTALIADYPAGEVQSWAQQTREAEAIAAEPQAAVPLLSAIAAARGLSVTELASRVLAKVQAYAVASGAIIGQRQALEDAIAAVDLAAPDAAAQLEAVTWPQNAHS